MTSPALRETENETALTRSVAEFASDPPDWRSLPREAVDMARNAVLDTAAVMIAGFGEPSVDILRCHVERTYKEKAEAGIVFGLGGAASAQAAALVNAAAAHVLDYDDIAFKAHPSAVLVPTLLAEAERIGASGRRLTTAYIVGYEVWAELASRDADSYHKKGWHPSSALGTVAATAALGALAGEDAGTISNALGIAAAHAGGLTGNFGTMAKHLQLGRTAAAALEALSLARLGMTGAGDILEHHGGLLSAFSPNGRVDLSGARLGGARWWSLETPLDFKRYPVCYGAHRVIDGVLRLMASHRLTAERVSAITVRLRAPQAAILRSHRPDNGLDARFSIEFAIAAPLVRGGLGLAELENAVVRDPRIQALMGKVAIVMAREDGKEPETERLWLTLEDGAVLDSGELPKAASNDDLEAKFFDCCATRGEIDAGRLHATITNLADLDDMRALSRASRGGEHIIHTT